MKKFIAISGFLIGIGWGMWAVRSAEAQSLTVWTTGQVVTASALNTNFTNLKNGKVGSGVLLVNADVSASAAIAHSKLATPALLPKAWAYVAAVCAGACTLSDSLQVTSITRTGAGVYEVVLSYTPANNLFLALPSSHTANVHCIVNGHATSSPQFIIRCYTDTTGAATDASLGVLVMDS
jgi:hypothetical protein